MTVAEWKAAVYQHRGLPASVRLLLVYLADHMADDLTVSVPQSVLMDALDLLRQHVAQMLRRACDEGLLHLVEPARGRTPAIYEATRRGKSPLASTPGARGKSPLASTDRRGKFAYASTDQATDPVDASKWTVEASPSLPIRATKVIPTELPLEDSPSPHLQLLVLDEDAETAPDSVTHGRVLHGSTSPAVSRRVGGPGGGIERPDVEALCRHLADRIEGNGNRRPTITKEWREEARRLIDNDKLPLEEAHELIDWCQDDGFWSPNILSMRKFRKQYDQLRGKRLNEQRRRPSTRNQLQAAYARAAARDQARGL